MEPRKGGCGGGRRGKFLGRLQWFVRYRQGRAIPIGVEERGTRVQGFSRNLGGLSFSCVTLRVGPPATTDQATGRSWMHRPAERNQASSAGTTSQAQASSGGRSGRRRRIS